MVGYRLRDRIINIRVIIVLIKEEIKITYWIFQGNPTNSFSEEHEDSEIKLLDNYVQNNKVIQWEFRQAHYANDISIGDYVFIWRSNRKKSNNEGIIALTTVVKEPYKQEENTFPMIDLEVLEYRLTNKAGMLLRDKLIDIPEINHLQSIHLSHETNVKLTADEFHSLHTLWENPTLLHMSTLERYLHLFKQDGFAGFSAHLSYIKESFSYFKRFKDPKAIKNMEWEDFQEMGAHINAFRMGIARARALGKQNHPIEQYRNSFVYLLHGDDPLVDRIDNFLNNDEYKLFGFGFNVLTEIIGNVYPEDYCFYNQRDRVAVENVLNIEPEYMRGDSDGTKFVKFHQSLKEHNIVDKYLDIVGQLTELPIYYEIDHFLSYIFERYKKQEPKKTEVSEPRYWLIAAGRNNKLWSTFQEKHQISIGWRQLGDLRNYKSKEEITKQLKEIDNLKTNPTNNGLANYEFAFKIQKGDYVFVKHGTQKIVGFGIVMSDYNHSIDNGRHHSFRHVDWLKVGEWDVSDLPVNLKTLTDITRYDDYVKKLLDRIEIDRQKDSVNGHKESDPYDIDKIIGKLFMDLQIIEDALVSLDYKKNIILQGPPGVGKTYIARRLAYLHMRKKKPENIQMIQFHQSYSYEEFIRGFKPSEEGQFKLEDGIFYQFCEQALANPDENYYFIIDEINRGNLSKIFGEVMMLIEKDKRGPEYAMQLAYPKENDQSFFIPENVYLIAMMNTADRSLSFVDYALRRRFAFIQLVPGFHTDAFENHLKRKGVSQGYIDKIRDFMKEVNEEIVKDKTNLGKGFEIGHSYFTPTEMIDEESLWYERVIQLEIKPLLEEYWFDQEDKVDDIIGKA